MIARIEKDVRIQYLQRILKSTSFLLFRTLSIKINGRGFEKLVVWLKRAKMNSVIFLSFVVTLLVEQPLGVSGRGIHIFIVKCFSSID